MLGLLLTASCAGALRVARRTPSMEAPVRSRGRQPTSQDEKDRRDSVCREVIEFAGGCDTVGSLEQCAAIVAARTSVSGNSGARKVLAAFYKALPAGDALRTAYDAVKARATSAEGYAASSRLGNSHGKNLLSVADMRERRQVYAARPLPSLTESGQRLALELQRGVATTAATPQMQLEGLDECACLGAFESTKAPFELKVAVAESVGATGVPEQGYCFISNALAGYTASLADAEHAKNERAIAMEGHLQEYYDGEMEKMAKPRRAAGKAASKAMHEGRFDAHGGKNGVLEAPVALTKAPGSFVTQRNEDGAELRAIANDVEAVQKIRVDSRVVCLPPRKSDLYGRLRPTALSKGSNLCPIKQRSVPAQIQ